MNARTPPARSTVRWVAALLASLAVAACGSVQPEALAPAGAGEQLTAQASVVALGAVIIDQVSLAHQAGALDEDGDAPASVELYNPGNLAVELAGFGLSNTAAQPFQWRFPGGVAIEPGQRLRVWLSGKNRAAVGAALHASFAIGPEAHSGAGRTLAPILLSAPNGAMEGLLLDRTTARFERADASWCRMPQGDAAAAFKPCQRASSANAAVSAATAVVHAAAGAP